MEEQRQTRIGSSIMKLRVALKRVSPAARLRTMAWYREQMALARKIEVGATEALHNLRTDCELAQVRADELAKLVQIQRIMARYNWNRADATEYWNQKNAK